MKSLKHIFGLLVMTAMIIAAGCNKEENGGKKENLPHPNSTYKACPILAHFGNEKLGIKEINMNNGNLVCCFDKEQRIIKATNGGEEYNFEYKYDTRGRLVAASLDWDYIISYDVYGFIDSICARRTENFYTSLAFKYSNDTVLMIEHRYCKDETDEWQNYILKFSEDLYITYQENINKKSWEKYRWENGNMVSKYNNEGKKWDYQYDNSANIARLTEMCFYLDITSDFSNKNNELNPNKNYTYNSKGLLEMITYKDEDGKEYVSRSYEYIYY